MPVQVPSYLYQPSLWIPDGWRVVIHLINSVHYTSDDDSIRDIRVKVRVEPSSNDLHKVAQSFTFPIILHAIVLAGLFLCFEELVGARFEKVKDIHLGSRVGPISGPTGDRNNLAKVWPLKDNHILGDTLIYGTFLIRVLSLSDLCEQCVEPRKEPVKALGLRDTPNHPRNGQGPQLQSVPTRTPNIQSLHHWDGQLKGQWQRAFERKYGNLLGLVNIEVQPVALSALTQYYDPPFKCFTFHDFQLAPTLEEYKRLIGIPFDKSPPYLFRGHYPSWASVARVLKVPESEILKLKKNRNGVEGIPEAALEERLQQL
ncbi:hypothetical protein CR513_14252, partial [Mucuna pruriens]